MQCNQGKNMYFRARKKQREKPPLPKPITQKEEENNDNQVRQALFWRQFLLYSFDIISQQVFLISFKFSCDNKRFWDKTSLFVIRSKCF